MLERFQSAIFTRFSMRDNRADFGGALYVVESDQGAFFEDGDFTTNSAFDEGGMLEFLHETLHMKKCSWC